MSLRQNLKNKCHVSNLGDNERPTVDSGNIKRSKEMIHLLTITIQSIIYELMSHCSVQMIVKQEVKPSSDVSSDVNARW